AGAQRAALELTMFRRARTRAGSGRLGDRPGFARLRDMGGPTGLEAGTVADDLASDGFSVARGVVPPELVAALVEATDEVTALEEVHFPPGDGQHGRVLFAPAYGGPFVELCAFDPLFEPIESLLGR